MDINKIVSIIRTLKEEGMTTGSSGAVAGFSALSPAGGPTAGTTNPMSGMQRRGIIGKKKFPGARTRWKNTNNSN